MRRLRKVSIGAGKNIILDIKISFYYIKLNFIQKDYKNILCNGTLERNCYSKEEFERYTFELIRKISKNWIS